MREWECRKNKVIVLVAADLPLGEEGGEANKKKSQGIPRSSRGIQEVLRKKEKEKSSIM
jgi:hypothetical protein